MPHGHLGRYRLLEMMSLIAIENHKRFPTYLSLDVVSVDNRSCHLCYPDVNHGFHNDLTPRYDQAVVEFAWPRTIDGFNRRRNLTA